MADAVEHLAAQQQVMLTQLADLRVDVRAMSELRGDVRALTARVDTQLDHGSRKMDALEKDLDALAARVGTVEAAEQRRGGAVSVWTLLLSVGGSSTGAAIVTWLITHAMHP